VVTVDEMHCDSVVGETDGAHDQDRDGCAIGHHDELSGDHSVGNEVNILAKKMICGSRV
jgi:hypothetical protein